MRAAARDAHAGKVVAPVEVIVRLGWLSAADLENWWSGYACRTSNA
jgi:hypothetical protein